MRVSVLFFLLVSFSCWANSSSTIILKIKANKDGSTHEIEQGFEQSATEYGSLAGAKRAVFCYIGDPAKVCPQIEKVLEDINDGGSDNFGFFNDCKNVKKVITLDYSIGSGVTGEDGWDLVKEIKSCTKTLVVKKKPVKKKPAEKK